MNKYDVNKNAAFLLAPTQSILLGNGHPTSSEGVELQNLSDGLNGYFVTSICLRFWSEALVVGSSWHVAISRINKFAEGVFTTFLFVIFWSQSINPTDRLSDGWMGICVPSF
jgi:hypothetical protein